jgi:hypothetical protein
MICNIFRVMVISIECLRLTLAHLKISVHPSLNLSVQSCPQAQPGRNCRG